jgi:hypothetical protein
MYGLAIALYRQRIQSSVLNPVVKKIQRVLYMRSRDGRNKTIGGARTFITLSNYVIIDKYTASTFSLIQRKSATTIPA